jgi:hypothetical protein
MLRILHCLDNRLADGDKVVSLTHRPRSTPQKHYFSTSGIHIGKKMFGLGVRGILLCVCVSVRVRACECWPPCREYRGYIIKYFVNCCEKEGIIYS